VFVLYGATEMVHGSGPMAVLTFGVFLTNADKAAALFGREFRFVLDERIRSFNTELTFFARTFFFVYLGLVVTLHDLDRVALEVAALSFLVVLVSRAAAIGVLRRTDPGAAEHAPLLAALVPRGLTSAVLAGFVWESGLPGGSRFMVLAFALILLTNFYMTWRLFVLERAVPPGPEPDGKMAQ
jgi:cell volume regulation protein A